MSKGMKVNWFEIPVIDMDRAIAFYEEVFAITINPIDFGGVLMGFLPPSEEVGATTGTLIKHESYTPQDSGTLLYFNSDDIHTELNRVAAAGGEVSKEKTMIGKEQGYMAVFLDSEGNRIALHSTS